MPERFYENFENKSEDAISTHSEKSNNASCTKTNLSTTRLSNELSKRNFIAKNRINAAHMTHRQFFGGKNSSLNSMDKSRIRQILGRKDQAENYQGEENPVDALSESTDHFDSENEDYQWIDKNQKIHMEYLENLLDDFDKIEM